MQGRVANTDQGQDCDFSLLVVTPRGCLKGAWEAMRAVFEFF